MVPFVKIPQKIDELSQELDTIKSLLSGYAEIVPQVAKLFTLVDQYPDWFECNPGEEKLEVIVRKLEQLISKS